MKKFETIDDFSTFDIILDKLKNYKILYPKKDIKISQKFIKYFYYLKNA